MPKIKEAKLLHLTFVLQRFRSLKIGADPAELLTMATRVMVVWVLILVSLNWAVYGFFRQAFNSEPLEHLKLSNLEQQLDESRRETTKLALRFSVFSDQMVAAGAKITPTTPWHSPMRAIASVISDPDLKETDALQSSVLAFQQGLRDFNAKKYDQAATELARFVDENPVSLQVPEAEWLLADGGFLLGKPEQSVRHIDFLITHFPETESAGKGLLLLGQILETRDRLDEAGDIYHLVLKEFPKSDCQMQAALRLKRLHL